MKHDGRAMGKESDMAEGRGAAVGSGLTVVAVMAAAVVVVR